MVEARILGILWVLLLLAPLAGLGAAVAARAQAPVPLEDCFDDTASVYPPNPSPGDIVEIRVFSCRAGDRLLEIKYSGLVLVTEILDGYTWKEYRVKLPDEPGLLQVVLDGRVVKSVSVGVAGEGEDSGEDSGSPAGELLLLAGAGVAGFLGMSLLARRVVAG